MTAADAGEETRRPQLTTEVQNQLDEVFFRQNRWIGPSAGFLTVLIATSLLIDIVNPVAMYTWLGCGLVIWIARVVGNHMPSLSRKVDARGTPWWINGSSGVVGLHFGLLAWIDPTAFRTGENWQRFTIILLALTMGGIVGLAGMAGNGRYALWTTWVLGGSALVLGGQLVAGFGLLFLMVYIARDLNATSSIMLETVYLRHESKAQAELARQQALHDPLTGLLNRFGLDEASTLLTASDAATAMYIDLDKFKEVNDSFGHPVGDQLLEQVARRLETRVRRTDIVARLGGDEFMLLLTDPLDAQTSTRLANEIIEELERPFLIGGHELHFSASIGITLKEGRALDVERLETEADKALYVAKNKGRSQAVVFESSTA